jgi:hypothetical protein
MYGDDEGYVIDDEIELAEQILFVSAAALVMTVTVLTGLTWAFLRGWIPVERS